jgi:hypothetical protein
MKSGDRSSHHHLLQRPGITFPVAPSLPGVELAGAGLTHLDAASRHHEKHGHLRDVLVRAGEAEAALY